MSITKIKNIIRRNFKNNYDVDLIQQSIFSHSTGAQKGINIEPVIKDVYTLSAAVPFGSYIKVATATTAYTMDCIGKAHSASVTYRRGDLVTSGAFVYLATQDIKSPRAFSATEWTKVAPKVIAAIPVTGGSTVCVGKYHNSINSAGFLVDDESIFSKSE